MYILSSPFPPHIVFLKKDAKTFEALEALHSFIYSHFFDSLKSSKQKEK